jgi:hypothetical protein
MNERIKELAKQVWGDTSGKPWSASAIAHLEHFAELVRQDEREACAKLCDDWLVGRDDICEVAAAIRGRTEPKSDFKNQMDDNWSGII